MTILVKQSLADQIYNQLREEIIEQKMTWGQKLNVNELQQRFGISSTPIREAINRLQKEGLVEYKNNVGANVIELDIKDIYEIQEAAMALDCAAIRYAMSTEKYEEIAEELKVIINKYKESENERIKAEYIEEFTYVFYKYANNSRLVSLAEHIKCQQKMLRSTYRNIVEKTSNMEEHEEMYSAVINKDLNVVIQAMELNYRRGTLAILNKFNNQDI